MLLCIFPLHDTILFWVPGTMYKSNVFACMSSINTWGKFMRGISREAAYIVTQGKGLSNEDISPSYFCRIK